MFHFGVIGIQQNETGGVFMDHMVAKVSCFARAFHHKHHQVHIFDDWAAETLLGADYGKIAENMMNGIRFFLPGYSGSPEEGLRLIGDQQLSPSVLGRSAFCERMIRFGYLNWIFRKC